MTALQGADIDILRFSAGHWMKSCRTRNAVDAVFLTFEKP